MLSMGEAFLAHRGEDRAHVGKWILRGKKYKAGTYTVEIVRSEHPDGLALAELQHRTAHDDGTFRVGGQMILYRVDANGITSRELCRWPDIIGDRIAA